jgi:hypothetical protein
MVLMGSSRIFSRWGLIGGGNSLGCPWRVHWHPYPFSLCFLATMRWAVCFTVPSPSWCSASPQARNNGTRQLWFQLWAKINFSSFKFISLMYSVTVMGSWLRQWYSLLSQMKKTAWPGKGMQIVKWLLQHMRSWRTATSSVLGAHVCLSWKEIVTWPQLSPRSLGTGTRQVLSSYCVSFLSL